MLLGRSVIFLQPYKTKQVSLSKFPIDVWISFRLEEPESHRLSRLRELLKFGVLRRRLQSERSSFFKFLQYCKFKPNSWILLPFIFRTTSFSAGKFDGIHFKGHSFQDNHLSSLDNSSKSPLICNLPSIISTLRFIIF